jgi:hypothetical protein
MLRTVLVLALVASSAASAQRGNSFAPPTPTDTTKPAVPAVQQRVATLKGPRIGLTLMTGAIAGELQEVLGVAPMIVQFGWQDETRLFTLANGIEGLTEHILLIGGVEQGAFLPSYTAMIGIRTKSGKEFGMGPNLSLAGAAYAFSAGTTIRSGPANIPVNFAIVPSSRGVRLSVLTGFNVQR